MYYVKLIACIFFVVLPFKIIRGEDLHPYKMDGDFGGIEKCWSKGVATIVLLYEILVIWTYIDSI